ncbi:phage/plasmid primase, P4 family, partial [Lactobacillus gallinarum]|uniref:phage/plasmid primase, P4 family n=1 Tax=Lactobacillus gallinarum TaxID=52242 RepID=UPI0019587A69
MAKNGDFYDELMNQPKQELTDKDYQTDFDEKAELAKFEACLPCRDFDKASDNDPIDGTPFGPTYKDVNEKVERLSAFKDAGKCFALMKIVPQENSNHVDKIPWKIDENNDKPLNWKNKTDTGFMTLYDAVFQSYKLSNDETQYEVGMLVQPPYLFLDIDDIPDEVDRDNLSDRIKEINKLTQNTYSEVSVSGKGLHFLFKGNKQPRYNKKGDYEFYGQKHWVTLTGNIFLNKEIKTLSDEQVDSLQNYLWGNPQASELNLIKPVSTPINKVSAMNVRQLLYKIRHSKNAEKFNNLWEGGNDSYTHKDGTPDESAGDQALCNLLAFWCDRDFDRMDAMFRQSPRFKQRSQKWDEKHYANGETYGHHTIQKAIDDVDTIYTGSNADMANVLIDPAYKDKDPYIKFDTNADLTTFLTMNGENWLNNNLDENKHKRTRIPDNVIIDILCTCEQFRKIYASELVKASKVPLYAYDWDRGVYTNDTEFMESLIQAVDPSCTKQTRQKDIIGSLKSNPRHKIPTVADMRAYAKTQSRFVHVRNGIYDLEQQKLLPASPEFPFTSYIDTNYNEDAFVEPSFDGWSLTHFLKQVAQVQQPDSTLKYDPKKYRLIWEIICAGILGISGLRKSAIWVDDGQGKTGKSTLLQLIRNVVGSDNTASLSFEDMADSQALVQAENKILIASDENETNIAITRTSNFKKIADGTPINLKRLYENMYSTVIHAFVIEATNAMPNFAKATQAVYERLVAVKFHTHFDYADKAHKRVQDEYIYDDTLLEWLLYHCLHDVKLGASLTETTESHELLSESSGTNDPLNGFVNYLKDQCHDFDDRIPTKAMYTLYCAYFFALQRSNNNNGDMPLNPLNKNAFTGAIKGNALFNDLYEYHKSMRLHNWSANGKFSAELARFSKNLPPTTIKNYKLGYTLTADQIKKFNGSL